ncbi:hypothetical protein SOVF_068380 [Spinacia oleracea]|nr:hypothetical protein SOVF_068380 [Spinacia oleracea]
MADIAMIVAEEYERRVKMMRKKSIGVDETKPTSSFLAPLERLRDYNLFHETHIQIKVVDHPKSQLGVAALDGLFSA